MKRAFVILALLACCRKEPDYDIDRFLSENVDSTAANTVCSCGKTFQELLNLESGGLQTVGNLQAQLGPWDTAWSEIAVVECTSFVYRCEQTFVSFHFRPSTMRFAGRSYGDIEDGHFVTSANLIEFASDLVPRAQPPKRATAPDSVAGE